MPKGPRGEKRLGNVSGAAITIVGLAPRRSTELDRKPRAEPSGERLERFWAETPLPPATGLRADKAFFDQLWGEDA